MGSSGATNKIYCGLIKSGHQIKLKYTLERCTIQNFSVICNKKISIYVDGILYLYFKIPQSETISKGTAMLQMAKLVETMFLEASHCKRSLMLDVLVKFLSYIRILYAFISIICKCEFLIIKIVRSYFLEAVHDVSFLFVAHSYKYSN